MIYTLLALFGQVLVWMTSLVPGRDHSALAWAVASQARSTAEAALVTAMAFRESSLDNAAVGDHGHSFCAMQIHDSSGGTAALLDDPSACVAAALPILRQSVRIDPLHPVGFYARGPRWRSVDAQRLSNDRVAVAKRLLAQQ